MLGISERAQQLIKVVDLNCFTLGMNTWCNANSVSFKCHSISVTFKFCAVLVALCAPEPRSTDSLGTQHCANFESHSNRVTFETNAISITSSIHAQCHSILEKRFNELTSMLLSCMKNLAESSITINELKMKAICYAFLNSSFWERRCLVRIKDTHYICIVSK